MSQLMELSIPDIGDFKNVPVIEVLVRPGDTIAVDTPLITLESDKATMDVPAAAAGVVRELLVQVGDRVSAGSPLLRLEVTAAAPAVTAPASVAEPATPVVAAPVASPTLPPSAAATPSLGPPAGPSVRALAREVGVELARVTGSGPKGRVRKEDVTAFVKRTLQASPAAGGGGWPDLLPWPQVDFAKYGPVQRHPLSRIRRLSGANLARNWALIPHVINFDEADITDLDAFRQAINHEQGPDGVKVTLLAFLMAAAVRTLQAFPDFNSSLDGDALVHKGYWNIGFAADTPQGLLVPVVRNAERKGLLALAAEIAELSRLARAEQLKPEQLQGGTFTISSLGGQAGTGFTPIINAPEVAILGVCRAKLQPVWAGADFVPRLMLPFSLAWDHRVVDGAAAARFTGHLGRLLADFRRALL